MIGTKDGRRVIFPDAMGFPDWARFNLDPTVAPGNSYRIGRERLPEVPGDWAGHIVHWDGDTKAQKTSWLVSDRFTRNHIPDQRTFFCLQGTGRPGPVNLPAKTLDQLVDQLHQPAQCGAQSSRNEVPVQTPTPPAPPQPQPSRTTMATLAPVMPVTTTTTAAAITPTTPSPASTTPVTGTTAPPVTTTWTTWTVGPTPSTMGGPTTTTDTMAETTTTTTPSQRVITVYNKVTNGSQMREDTPAYLSTRTANYCKRDGCALAGTDMVTGAQITAVCQANGARTTNGHDTDSADDSNPELFESTRWYGIRWGDGRFGYISEVWITAGDRGGIGLPAC